MKDFNHSYWEIKHYFKTQDLIIIGSGIVGLSTAISFKQKNPKAKILVLEKGILPDGASTKNAGFACFGSPGELLDDLKNMPENEVWETVKMRWQGLKLLRKRLGDKNLDFKSYGGFEIFNETKDYERCKEKISFLNNEIKNTLGLKNCYSDVSQKKHSFNKVKGILFNAYEGQIDTSLLMKSLKLVALKSEIEILNTIKVSGISEFNEKVQVQSDFGTFNARKVVVATNGFAKSLLKIEDVKPARAQVLVTKPIKNLKIKGTFHFQNGYYYFRNINDRVLFGGGRNLDFKGETTSLQGLNNKIQKKLEVLLREMILPDTFFEIENRWSGIMGVGSEKKPIIEFVGKNILAAVRMGGMGIAIGSQVGKKAAEAIS